MADVYIWMTVTMSKQALVTGALLLGPWIAMAAGTNDDGAAHAPAAWASMDSNSDGVLTKQEVSTTPWADRFEQIDRNGDGKATKQEFSAYMKAMKKSQAERDAAQNN